MGIKLFNKKSGKCYQESSNDKQGNSDTKVTETMLSNEDPEAAKEEPPSEFCGFQNQQTHTVGFKV